MTSHRTIYFVVGFLLCVSAPLRAQEPAFRVVGQTRTLVNIEGGSASGLGYDLPHLKFGLAIEKPLFSPKTWRLEAQGEANWSPDRKIQLDSGNTLLLSGKQVFWLSRRIGSYGGAEYSHLWTSAYQKHAWLPSAGAVVRDSWYGNPGRFYIDYFFPTGCQWGSACPIQSNRASGIEAFQEFRTWRHWRIGGRVAWVHFASQSNPLRPDIPRIWSNTGTIAVVVRYEFRAESVDTPY